MRDDFETRRMRADAEFDRFTKQAFAWTATAGVFVFLVVVALIVWIVLRLT